MTFSKPLEPHEYEPAAASDTTVWEMFDEIERLRTEVNAAEAALAESTARADLAEVENAELRRALTALIDVDMALRDRIEAPMFLRARGIMVVQSAKTSLPARWASWGRGGVSNDPEIRCPYCNGTALLPESRVRQIEADRDEFAVRKQIVEMLWGLLSDLTTAASPSKKTMSLESLRLKIKGAHRSASKWMNLDRITGR